MWIVPSAATERGLRACTVTTRGPEANPTVLRRTVAGLYPIKINRVQVNSNGF